MHLLGATTTTCLLLCSIVTAIPKPEEQHHNIDHLAHASHLAENQHDLKYDHEQFLGEDQAKTFDQLLPEESRRRLA